MAAEADMTTINMRQRLAAGPQNKINQLLGLVFVSASVPLHLRLRLPDLPFEFCWAYYISCAQMQNFCHKFVVGPVKHYTQEADYRQVGPSVLHESRLGVRACACACA